MKRLILAMVVIKPSEKAKEEKAKKEGKRVAKKPVISKEELREIQNHVQSEKFIAEVTKLFYQSDKDKSGYLDFEEVKECVSHLF